MIGICNKCGNHSWDKIVTQTKVKCPKCGFEWDYIRLPMFVLSGCSGIGKTTTSIEIMKKYTDIIVMDSDIFCGIQNATNDEDYRRRIDIIEAISKNINQCGKPVLWTIAGNLDMLPTSYNSRFFDGIYCLALVAETETLKKHMKDGRGITDVDWIEGSIAYNSYFKSHDSIGELSFNTLDIDGKTPDQVASDVIDWIKSKLNKNTVD